MKEKNTNDDRFNKKIYKHLKRFVVAIVTLICLANMCTYFNVFSKLKSTYIDYIFTVKSVSIKDDMLNICFNNAIFGNDRWCQVIKDGKGLDANNWIKVENNNCNIKMENGLKYILIRDSEYLSDIIPVGNYISEIISLKYDNDKIMLALDQEIDLNIEIYYIGNADLTINLVPEQEGILEINGKHVKGIGNGSTNLKICDNYNHEIIVPVTVTDLITAPTLNPNKTFLKAYVYTEEEAHLLDEILEKRVNDAGLKTRAGVVAAARFITLEFKYKVPYFLENGRFQDNGFSSPVDGEGRYYHKGLYLSRDKFATIKRYTRRKPCNMGRSKV